ncbi:DotI/IcmL family type IV secretion protein [Legionella sp. km772]|uniref:DotI/IcmL family type IV secretion protein n=1 Tax=Legionella sp. km772 TaxID=2498111 RepID=UPI000F8F12DC|nr:DotI/IcmL family type IV secretion protein [Legionella sp. km772]RUR11160.1 type IV secretion protein IcmL [Legionella sp. km772]
MKNTMLCYALISFVCANAQAETQTSTTTTTATPPAVQGTQPASPVQAQPTTTTTTTTTTTQAAVINCDYKIPASTKVIDQTLVLNWSEKATIQAFDFDPNKLEEQMKSLQNCFTEQGWSGFNNALQKSGNIDSIKAQKLTVSSQIDSQATMDEAKDNQWKLTLPLQVVYQNDKEKVTQLLSIKLTVGRKISGDLGITQMIATPRVNTTAQTNTTATTTPTSTSTNTNTPAVTTPNDTTKAPTTATPSGTPTTPTVSAPTVGDPSAQPSNSTNTPVDQQPATTSTTPNP